MSPVDNRRVAPWISYCRVEDEFWILDHRSDVLTKLNPAASQIFSQLIHGESGSAPLLESACAALRHVLAAEPGGADGEPGGANGEPPAIEDNSDSYFAYRYLRELALNKCVPLFATLELTFRCNFDCMHCYRPRACQETMTLDRWKTLLVELKQMGTLNVVLTGGEPLAWPGLAELVEFLRELRMAFIVKTNGWLLDEAMASFLAEHFASEVHVSLYGANDDVHDRVTHVPGSFQRAIQAITRCQEIGLSTRISCCLTRDNWEEFRGVMEVAERHGVGLNFAPVLLPSMAATIDYRAIRVTEEQLKQFCEATVGDGNFRVLRVPGAPVCSAARSNCSIAPDGNVYPCNGFWYRCSTQSVLERSFREVWENSEVLRRVRRLTNSDMADCSACSHFEFCPRCPGLGYEESGELTGKSPGDCLYASCFHDAYRTRPPAAVHGLAGSFGPRCS